MDWRLAGVRYLARNFARQYVQFWHNQRSRDFIYFGFGGGYLLLLAGVKYNITDEMRKSSTWNRRYVKKWKEYHAEQAKLAAVQGH